MYPGWMMNKDVPDKLAEEKLQKLKSSIFSILLLTWLKSISRLSSILTLISSSFCLNSCLADGR